jgi:hypothetical protein
LGRNSATAVLLYIDLFIEGVLGRGPHAVDAWHLGRELSAYVQKFPQLKAELKKRYEAVGAGPARTMLEHFFGEFGDDDNLVAWLRNMQQPVKPAIAVWMEFFARLHCGTSPCGTDPTPFTFTRHR